jgi:hypothetical protein
MPEVTTHHEDEDTYRTWVGAGPHAGVHPQRPIPAVDETQAPILAAALAADRRALGERRPPPDPPAPPLGTVWVDPARPSRGVVYVGPTAEEELALRHGISLEQAREIAEAPGKRMAAAADAAKAGSERASSSSEKAEAEAAPTPARKPPSSSASGG